MPQSCCAVGCANRKIGAKKNLPFYNIPKGKSPIERRRREAWIKAICQNDWNTGSEDKMSKAKICVENCLTGSYHAFITYISSLIYVFDVTTLIHVFQMSKMFGFSSVSPMSYPNVYLIKLTTLFVGKRSDDTDKRNWIPTCFEHATDRDHKKMKGHEKSRNRFEQLQSKREKAISSWRV